MSEFTSGPATERPEGVVDFTPDPELYPFESKWFTSSVGPIHYIDEGTGRPLVMFHGNPDWSFLYRKFIAALSQDFRCIAPDYPGYGNSSMPAPGEFEYTFDHLTDIVEQLTEQLELDQYVLYLMDYGAPVGFRLATRHPERVAGLIIQNGNAYEEGLREFWDPIKAYWNDPTTEHRDALRSLLTREATIWQYTHGTRDPESISPDNWNIDQPLLDLDLPLRPLLAPFGEAVPRLELFPTRRVVVDRVVSDRSRERLLDV